MIFRNVCTERNGEPIGDFEQKNDHYNGFRKQGNFFLRKLAKNKGRKFARSGHHGIVPQKTTVNLLFICSRKELQLGYGHYI
jgi:hypothetical protein